MILAEHAGLTQAEIEIRVEDFADSVAYAESIGAVAVVRSTLGLTGFLASAASVYPDIQCFVPVGPNTSVEITDPAAIPVIVTCGAGDTDNDTAYGAALEFWDRDADENPSDDASSYANGRICGKLLYIKDTLGISWWQARYIARMTASNGGSHNNQHGYGQIIVAAALAYDIDSLGIIDDPYQTGDQSVGQEEVVSAEPVATSALSARFLKRAHHGGLAYYLSEQ
jgi:hypothetical protein